MNGMKMPMFINRWLTGLIGSAFVLFVMNGCSAHIRPKPNFIWPEMADSKISGKLALFISPHAEKAVTKSLPGDEFKHNDLMIGQATARLVHQVCLSVFQDVVVFDKMPDTQQLKDAGFRGILKLDSIATIINMPKSSLMGDSAIYTDMSIRLGLNCSAEDFLIKQEIPSTFGPDGQYGKKFSGKEIKAIDKILKDLSERILKESGANLAQSLANIYGARQ
jgi:hypothetical protein